MAGKKGMRGHPKIKQTSYGLRKAVEIAILNVESMVSAEKRLDFSRSSGGELPAHEGQTDEFVKSRIHYHITTRVLPALKRALSKIDILQQEQQDARKTPNNKGVRRTS